ncbi:uncharacterized protein MYCFIDRAFT_198484 [Pseudocercospora fijiensis CIRAD86]|uniref:Uncharacterized protein n=1 Tax=Pseudocercospora fijiensis (strain CIRAD86) TaxID=383855 RepID=M2YR57_PSEFD|nr:uncharacterized protein MYCFIDRAFT_198484 [Pseudocercospora fijiensis CIRAD86]EME80190.1 hypothetical protein MYCFIDRAFT_198484 [Pseudocercospora fijiensis CIRAD86]
MGVRGNELTINDMRLLSDACHCFEGGFPKVNFKKLAARAGYTNLGSAMNAWNRVRTKLLAASGELEMPTDAISCNTGNGKARKRDSTSKKRRREDNVDSVQSGEDTPKRARKIKREALAPITVQEAVEEDEDDFSGLSSVIDDEFLDAGEGSVFVPLAHELSLLTDPKISCDITEGRDTGQRVHYFAPCPSTIFAPRTSILEEDRGVKWNHGSRIRKKRWCSSILAMDGIYTVLSTPS